MQCFSIVPKLIKKPVDLLKVLLSLHSRKIRLPDFLVEYLLDPVERIVKVGARQSADCLCGQQSPLCQYDLRQPIVS